MQSPIIEKGVKSNEKKMRLKHRGVNRQLSNYNMDSGHQHRS